MAKGGEGRKTSHGGTDEMQRGVIEKNIERGRGEGVEILSIHDTSFKNIKSKSA